MFGGGKEHGGAISVWRWEGALVTICLAVYYLLKIGFKFSAMATRENNRINLFEHRTSTIYIHSEPTHLAFHFHLTLIALPELVLLLLLLPSTFTSLMLLAMLGVTGAL